MRTNRIAQSCCRIPFLKPENALVGGIQREHSLQIKPVTIEDIDSRIAGSNVCFQEWKSKYKQSKIETGFDGKYYLPPDEGASNRVQMPVLPGSWARLVQRKRRRFLNSLPGRQ